MMQATVTPFQGPAELVPTSTRPVMRVAVMGMIAMGAMMAVSAAPAPWLDGMSAGAREVLAQVLNLGRLAFVAWFVHALSQAMRTRTRPVSVFADGRGLFVDGQLVAPREAMRVAAIRLPRGASEHPTRGGQALVIDSAPMTVEVVTEADAWSLSLGGFDRSAALLAAMGFPPATIPAEQPRLTTRADIEAQRPFKVAIAVVVSIALLISVGGSVFVSLRR